MFICASTLAPVLVTNTVYYQAVHRTASGSALYLEGLVIFTLSLALFLNPSDQLSRDSTDAAMGGVHKELKIQITASTHFHYNITKCA
jgi:hypothetical protein